MEVESLRRHQEPITINEYKLWIRTELLQKSIFFPLHFAADAEHHLFTEEGPDDITSSPKSDAASQVKRERPFRLCRTIPYKKMSGSPALLLLLALGLCEYGHRVVHHLHREGQVNPFQ